MAGLSPSVSSRSLIMSCKCSRARCTRLCTGSSIKGWIRAEWKDSENNRRAKYYSLTAAGRKQLKSELENWRRLSGAIGIVIEAV